MTVRQAILIPCVLTAALVGALAGALIQAQAPAAAPAPAASTPWYCQSPANLAKFQQENPTLGVWCR